jgi:hydroxymethylpyrimidine/phosphomethylpyrimidine kinase
MPSTSIPPQVLTIAGSDSGGGAGIQADIRVISAHGAFPLSVITAITAQNTRGVSATFEVPPSVIESQIRAVFDDFTVSAVKTGMLSSKKVVQQVARLLAKRAVRNLVVDPVMVSKNGYPLLKATAISALKSELFPLAHLVTPNIDEAEQLAGIAIRTIQETEEAAQIILKSGCKAVLIKGGHLRSDPGCDLFYDGKKFVRFKDKWIDSPNTHGTGCVYSAAIAANRAQGIPLETAIKKAKKYLTQTIRYGLAIGHGQGPVNPVAWPP